MRIDKQWIAPLAVTGLALAGALLIVMLTVRDYGTAEECMMREAQKIEDAKLFPLVRKYCETKF